MAVLSAKGIETHWPIINRTTPLFHKWVYGGFALAFLVWALVVIFTVHFDRLRKTRLGKIVERSSEAATLLALTMTGIGWIQGIVLAVQAGLGEWYFWVIFVLGLVFIVMYATSPLRLHQKRKAATTDSKSG